MLMLKFYTLFYFLSFWQFFKSFDVPIPYPLLYPSGDTVFVSAGIETVKYLLVTFNIEQNGGAQEAELPHVMLKHVVQAPDPLLISRCWLAGL